MSKKISKKVIPLSQEIIPSEKNFNLKNNYLSIEKPLSSFTSENAPSSYKELKKEVKFLEKIHAQSFVILAHRLKKIRDNELYKKDGYDDFKSFIENELEVGRTSVYNYISILEVFGVQTFEREVKISNLITILKPLKENPQDKGFLLDKANNLSNRDLQKFIKEKYITKNEEKDKESSFSWFSSKEDLLKEFFFLKKGMREKTQIKMMKALLNLRMIEDPKNQDLIKIKKIIEKL